MQSKLRNHLGGLSELPNCSLHASRVQGVTGTPSPCTRRRRAHCHASSREHAESLNTSQDSPTLTRRAALQVVVGTGMCAQGGALLEPPHSSAAAEGMATIERYTPQIAPPPVLTPRCVSLRGMSEWHCPRYIDADAMVCSAPNHRHDR